MRCTEILKTSVSPKVKLKAKAVADREFLSEAAWLKRLVMREIRAGKDGSDADSDLLRSESIPVRQARVLGTMVPAGPCWCA